MDAGLGTFVGHGYIIVDILWLFVHTVHLHIGEGPFVAQMSLGQLVCVPDDRPSHSSYLHLFSLKLYAEVITSISNINISKVF